MKSGVIINPKSAKTGRKGRALSQALAATPDVLTSTLDDFSLLPEILKSYAEQGVEVLAVSGGDGTVQSVQTHLIEGKIFKNLPRLAVLPHGTTNMTAADVGLRVTAPQQVAALLNRPGYLARATNVRTRRTVKVQNLGGVSTQHGMFFGTGAIYRAVLLCQRDIHGLGLKGEIANGVTLITTLARSIFARASDQGDADRIDRGYAMTITADGELKASYDQLLFLATTLDRLILGMRPFWNVERNKLRATAIAYPHPNIFRYLLPVMYGGDERRLPEPDFTSFSAERIGLATEASMVIDGEIFEPPERGEIKVSTGPQFEYFCG